jgi:hypothetical protein
MTKTLGLEHNKVDDEIAVRVGYQIATKPIVKLWNIECFWLDGSMLFLPISALHSNGSSQHKLGR